MQTDNFPFPPAGAAPPPPISFFSFAEVFPTARGTFSKGQLRIGEGEKIGGIANSFIPAQGD